MTHILQQKVGVGNHVYSTNCNWVKTSNYTWATVYKGWWLRIHMIIANLGFYEAVIFGTSLKPKTEELINRRVHEQRVGFVSLEEAAHWAETAANTLGYNYP